MFSFIKHAAAAVFFIKFWFFPPFRVVLSVVHAKGVFNLWFCFGAHRCIVLLVVHAKGILICGPRQCFPSRSLVLREVRSLNPRFACTRFRMFCYCCWSGLRVLLSGMSCVVFCI